MFKAYLIKSVIFDMDGVITNTMPDHYLAWKQVLKLAGIDATHIDIYSREGQRGLTSLQEISQHYGKFINPIFAQKLLKTKEEIFKKIARQRYIVGARSFLKSLHRQGYRLALVTGTSRHEVERILPKTLYDLFEVTVTGSDVKHGKPHPEPYKKAIAQLRIKSSEAIVIENAPFGIQSAKGAEIYCVAIETSLPSEYLEKADLIVRSFNELKRKIRFSQR